MGEEKPSVGVFSAAPISCFAIPFLHHCSVVGIQLQHVTLFLELKSVHMFHLDVAISTTERNAHYLWAAQFDVNSLFLLGIWGRCRGVVCLWARIMALHSLVGVNLKDQSHDQLMFEVSPWFCWQGRTCVPLKSHWQSCGHVVRLSWLGASPACPLPSPRVPKSHLTPPQARDGLNNLACVSGHILLWDFFSLRWGHLESWGICLWPSRLQWDDFPCAQGCGSAVLLC